MKRVKRPSPQDELLDAVGRFINANGGNALVVGGIRVEHDPLDLPMTYRLSIRFTGRPPKPKRRKKVKA